MADLVYPQNTSRSTLSTLLEIWPFTLQGSLAASLWKLSGGARYCSRSISNRRYPPPAQAYWCTWDITYGFETSENPSICQVHQLPNNNISWPFICMTYLATPPFWKPVQKPICLSKRLTIRYSKQNQSKSPSRGPFEKHPWKPHLITQAHTTSPTTSKIHQIST